MATSQTVFKITKDSENKNSKSVCVVSPEEFLVDITNLINNQARLDRRLAKIERKINGDSK